MNQPQTREWAADLGCLHDADGFENLPETAHLSAQTASTEIDTDFNPDNGGVPELADVDDVCQAAKGLAETLLQMENLVWAQSRFVETDPDSGLAFERFHLSGNKGGSNFLHDYSFFELGHFDLFYY